MSFSDTRSTRHGLPATDQIQDAAIACRILSELGGPGWKPLSVQFLHARPAEIVAYRRAFRARVRFEAEVSAVVFASSWFERPIEGADPALYDGFAKAIQKAEAEGPMSFGDQVQAVLHQMLLSGTASAGAVARMFGIHERTLRRRMAEEGKSLRQIVNKTRLELALQLL